MTAHTAPYRAGVAVCLRPCCTSLGVFRVTAAALGLQRVRQCGGRLVSRRSAPTPSQLAGWCVTCRQRRTGSPPADAAALAAQRGYLPERVPLLKLVRAIAPQEVCVIDGIVRIDGVRVAAVLRADRLGRPLRAWPSCRRLRPDELFLLSVTNRASFDSRYFGPVHASAVLGIAQPIWLEVRP